MTHVRPVTVSKKGKHICTSHQIRNSVIEELLLSGIREITGYVRENEAEFVEMITKKSKAETDRGLHEAKRELDQSQTRIRKLDDIIQKLYEDNVDGKISDDRFMKLSESYENEQAELKDRIAELQGFISNEQESAINTDRFIRLVKKYTDVQELNAEIIREFVEKIYIYKAERVGGKKVQKIKIVWNCIGDFMPPVKEKTA
jgi:predicted RNase H-like nuclease (RuvC/YqgF family)